MDSDALMGHGICFSRNRTMLAPTHSNEIDSFHAEIHNLIGLT